MNTAQAFALKVTTERVIHHAAHIASDAGAASVAIEPGVQGPIAWLGLARRQAQEIIEVINAFEKHLEDCVP